MMMKIETWNENGEEITVTVPTRREVCGRCEGSGKHVNPSIDEHGISPEEFDEDPDFREAYFSGRYDVPCEECHGNNVVEVIDRALCTPEQIEAWEWREESLRPCPIQAAERAMGA